MKGREVVATEAAPAAIGPYSQAVRAGGWVFVSGQIPLDPASGVMLSGPIGAQAERALLNLKAVLEAAGCTLDDVVKTTVYLRDLEDFEALNEVYGRFFTSRPPARACVQAARLPRDAALEIDCIACL